jgi:hypothetical protein
VMSRLLFLVATTFLFAALSACEEEDKDASGSGGAEATCPASDQGKACPTEGASCSTGLRCEPLRLYCTNGVWSAKQSTCGDAGSGGGAGSN